MLALTLALVFAQAAEPPAIPAPPAAQEIAAALEVAAKKNQRVLLVWGAEW